MGVCVCVCVCIYVCVCVCVCIYDPSIKCLMFSIAIFLYLDEQILTKLLQNMRLGEYPVNIVGYILM